MNYFNQLYQTYLRLQEDKFFAAKHPMLSQNEFIEIQKRVWIDIPSGNGEVEYK